MAEVQTLRVTTADANALWQFYRNALKRVRNVELPLMAPPVVLEAVRVVLGQCGGDMAIAERVVEAFVSSDHRWWSERKWSMAVLRDPRDFSQAFQLVGGSAKRQTMADVMAELMTIDSDARSQK